MNQSLETKLSSPSNTSDQRRIVVGAGYRLPAAPAHVEDRGKISTGAGYRLPTERRSA